MPKRSGHDAYGAISVTGGPCEVCSEPKPNFTVHYDNLDLPMDIDVAGTILKSTDRHIGILCGCYSKFHRQVTHILERKERRG